jgi:hypothetical protein
MYVGRVLFFFDREKGSGIVSFPYVLKVLHRQMDFLFCLLHRRKPTKKAKKQSSLLTLLGSIMCSN